MLNSAYDTTRDTSGNREARKVSGRGPSPLKAILASSVKMAVLTALILFTLGFALFVYRVVSVLAYL